MRLSGLSILFLILLLNVNAVLTAQQKTSIPFKRYAQKIINYEQGLSNNFTTDIITDVKGFTWVSTITGMQRYNGYSLEDINPVVNQDSIKINYPVFFFGLQNGNIWISYKKGVLEYNPHLSTFKKLISFEKPASLSFNIIPVAETGEGIWALELHKGVVLYNKEGKELSILPGFSVDKVDDLFHQPDNIFRSLFCFSEKCFFVRLSADEVVAVDVVRHQFHSAIQHADEKIISISCNHEYLFMVSNKGICRLNLSDYTVQKHYLFSGLINEPVQLATVWYNGIDQLLVSVNHHLLQFNVDLVFDHELKTFDRSTVINTGSVYLIYPDQFKRIWLITNDDIRRIQNVGIPFDHYIYPEEDNNFVRSLFYDEQRKMMIAGCFNGSIQIYDSIGNPELSVPLSIKGVNYIIGIEKLSSGHYLIQTLGSGLFLFDYEHRSIKPYILSKEQELVWDTHSVVFANNIQRVNDSVVLFATAKNIASCVFKKDLLVNVHLVFSDSLKAGDYVDCFHFAGDGTIWVGTRSGQLISRTHEGKSTIYEIPGRFLVRCISEDSEGNIWVGTDKGLYTYAKQGKLIHSMTRATGLLNDCIYSLLPAVNGAAVYAGSNLGLSFISTDGTYYNYPKELGLQGNEFNTAAVTKTQAGKYFFGGVNGITGFLPEQLNIARDTPVLNITRLVVNDSVYNFSIQFRKGDSVLLSYQQNHLQIDFAALGLLNNDEYLYAYRLKGFENEWQTTHDPRGIKYILEPGNYVLEIKCSPILSAKSIFTKSFVIMITPPWWQTWWFNGLIIFVIIGLIVLSVLWYNRRQYQQKIRSLQLQSEIQSERERISRDLHDNIGAYASAISSDIERMQFHPDTGRGLLQNLQHNVGEIITSLRETIWALNKESITVTGISDRFKSYINKILPSYPDLQVVFEEDIAYNITLKPMHALNIFRIMQEAFHNAVKHSHCKMIRVQIKAHRQMTIVIEDDGDGIDPESNKKEGNGLRNMKLRAREVGLMVEIKAAAVKGTSVIIIDPTT